MVVDCIVLPESEYNLLLEDSMNYIRRSFDNSEPYMREQFIQMAKLRGLPPQFIEQLQKDLTT